MQVFLVVGHFLPLCLGYFSELIFTARNDGMQRARFFGNEKSQPLPRAGKRKGRLDHSVSIRTFRGGFMFSYFLGPLHRSHRFSISVTLILSVCGVEGGEERYGMVQGLWSNFCFFFVFVCLFTSPLPCLAAGGRLYGRDAAAVPRRAISSGMNDRKTFTSAGYSRYPHKKPYMCVCV